MMRPLFESGHGGGSSGDKYLPIGLLTVTIILLIILVRFWFTAGPKPANPVADLGSSSRINSFERKKSKGNPSRVKEKSLPRRHPINPSAGRFFVKVVSEQNMVVSKAIVRSGAEKLRTDGSGLVVFQAVPKELRIFHPEYAPYCHHLTDKERNRHGIVVVLRRGADLRCLVTDIYGQKLQNALVEVSCGGIAGGGDEEDWLLSRRAARNDKPIYWRKLRTDKNGECNFRGLSAQPHKVTCRLYGYLDAQDQGNSFGRTVNLNVGFNSVTIVLSPIYAQVVIVQNKTGLPNRIFKHLLFYSGSCPKGAFDIYPSLSEVSNAAKEKIKSTVNYDARSDAIYIHLAWSPYPDKAFDKGGDVFVQFFYGGKWKIKPKWTPLAKLGPQDVKRIVVSKDLHNQLGLLKVITPYDVGAHPVHKSGNITPLGYVFRPSNSNGIERVLPIGEYVLKPSSDFLNSRGRSVKVKVIANKCTEVDLRDNNLPTARLVVFVLDESGSGPAYDNCRIMVDCLSGRAKGTCSSCRPAKRFYPDGKWVIVCEPGDYRIRVCRGGWPPIWRKELNIAPGADVLIKYKLGE